MTTRRAAEARLTALEEEVRRRRSASEVQAEFAIAADNREAEDDTRPDEELSSSELQARAATRRMRGRGGWKALS